jgi:hypothetical protein
MLMRAALPLALAAALAAHPAPSASAQTPAPPQPAEDSQAQAQTIKDMRNVGTAIFSWLTDRIEDADADPKTDRACASRNTKAGGACKVVEIDRLPVISHQDLTRLLVPNYIASIPEKDAWGNPFEFRLDLRHVLNRSVMAIRSAGSDRTFSGNRYELGTFPPAETGQDLVWMDGYFIRWPDRQGIKDPR